MIKKIKTPKKSSKKNVLFSKPSPDPTYSGEGIVIGKPTDFLGSQHPVTKFMKNIFGSGQSVNTSESLTAGPKGYTKRKR